MRKVIYIPVIHTPADMGALADPIRALTIEKLGREKWRDNIAAIERFWIAIRQEVETWSLAYSRVRLYQDGLPLCGRETDIVSDLAKAGSPNHRLLLDLMQRGATLMGTESSELLLEEYSLMQRVVGAGGLEEAALIEEQQKVVSQDLLERRDRYIAARIDATLSDGEVGILFIGMLHAVERWLPENIRVSHPFGPSPARRPERH